MRCVTFILAVAFCVATALPADKVQSVENSPSGRNSAIEQLLIDILEGLREVMLEGADDIPILDPLEIEHLHLDLDDLGMENSFVTLGDLVVEKLSTYVIDDVSVSLNSLLLQRYTIVVDGHIPVLEIDASKYSMSVSAMGMNIFGNGHAKMKIVEPRIRANIVASISLLGGISASLNDANIMFSLGAFQPEIVGMFDDDITNDFINAFLSYLVPDLVEFFEDEISDVLSELVIQLGNEILGNSLVMTKYDESIRKIAEEANNLALTEDSQNFIGEPKPIPQDMLRVQNRQATSDLDEVEFLERIAPLIQNSIMAARKDVMDQQTVNVVEQSLEEEQVKIGMPKLPQVKV